MNILLINHYAGSPDMGMEFRPYYLAREWVKLGHRVDILAGDFSHLRKQNPCVSRDFETQTIDGINYHWLRTGAYHGNGGKRAVTMFRFTGKLWRHAARIARELEPDVVIASSTYPLDTYPARKIAKKAGVPYVHEVHDLWPLTLIEVGGMSPKHPFVRVLQKAENDAYRRADSVVSLMPCAQGYMMEHGLAPEKFHHVSNGVAAEDWSTPLPLPEEHARLLSELKAQGKHIVCYFGGHAISNMLDGVLDAAALLRDDPGVAFVLVGDGVEKPRLMARAEQEGLEQVYFLPPVPKLAVPSLLSQIDLICICGKQSTLSRFGICLNKMYDSMMAGKPIICALIAPNDDVTENGCGKTIPPEDPAALAAAVRELLALPEEERLAMGQRGRQAAAEQYEYRALAKKFLDVIHEIR